MKRGRPATKGLDDATAIARKRGCVMQIVYASDSVCDFLIRTAALVIFVRAVRFDKIVAPVSEIEHACRGIIAELRLFPRSEQIRLELWIYSRHGTYRFFRLTGAGLEEIRQDGEVAPAAVSASAEEEETIPAMIPAENRESTSPATVPATGDTRDPASDGSPT